MNETVKILITGDFYGGSRIDHLIQNGMFKDIFGDLLPLIQDNDLKVTNLESPVILKGSPIPKTGPSISSHPQITDALNYAGFNLVTLANNHIMDYGEEGLNSTMQYCNKASISYTGAGSSLADARKSFDITLKKTSVSILNFCENEWSTTRDEKAGANPLNPVTNYADIAEAAGKSEHVIVILHGGNELYQLPSPRMQELCRFYIEAGAGIVVCHHAHYYSGFEKYKAGMIFYGLGNFIFDNPRFRKHKWNQGIAVQLEFTPGSVSHQLIPYIQCDDKPGLRQLDKDETNEFNKSINSLNTVIQDPGVLNQRFEEFCLKVKKQYFNYLEPYSNRYLNALYRRGFLPSLLTKDKKRLYHNLIRCEAHRDVLINILDK